MDGTGPSGFNIDTAKGNVYGIQYQWLGFGVITFWVSNSTTGDFILVHTINYPNSNTVPSVYNPTLPLMAKVSKTSGTSNVILQTSSGVGLIEGPIDDTAVVTRNSKSNYKNIAASSPTPIYTNIISIINNSTFQSKNNRVRIKLDYLSVSTDGTKTVTIKLVKNATLGGTPVYNNINANTSVVPFDVDGTTVTGGADVLTFTLGKVDTVQFEISNLNITLQPGNTFTIAATSTANAQVDVALSWIEFW